jgi:hypothetical protein
LRLSVAGPPYGRFFRPDKGIQAMNSMDAATQRGAEEPSPKWRERSKALRLNTPPIIRMV